MKLLTAANIKKLKCNGIQNSRPEQQDKPFDFFPVVKLFQPDGAATWLLTELVPHEPDLAFGLCDLGIGFPEMGYVRLSELDHCRGKLGLLVERDRRFEADRPLPHKASSARPRSTRAYAVQRWSVEGFAPAPRLGRYAIALQRAQEAAQWTTGASTRVLPVLGITRPSAANMNVLRARCRTGLRYPVITGIMSNTNNPYSMVGRWDGWPKEYYDENGERWLLWSHAAIPKAIAQNNADVQKYQNRLKQHEKDLEELGAAEDSEAKEEAIQFTHELIEIAHRIIRTSIAHNESLMAMQGGSLPSLRSKN